MCFELGSVKDIPHGWKVLETLSALVHTTPLPHSYGGGGKADRAQALPHTPVQRQLWEPARYTMHGTEAVEFQGANH